MDESEEVIRGRLLEKTDGLERQLANHIEQTDRRFVRLENRISDGFAASQADREAGAKALGDLIKALGEKVEQQQTLLSEGKGALGLSSRVIDIIVMLFGGCLGGVVMRFWGH